VPIALVSLVDGTKQFFKTQQGLPSPVSEVRQTPLTHSFCQHVVIDRAPLVVTDAETDPRVCDNLAVPELGVKAPAHHQALACDRVPRHFEKASWPPMSKPSGSASTAPISIWRPRLPPPSA